MTLDEAVVAAKQRLREAVEAVFARAAPPTKASVADPTTPSTRIVEIWRDVDRALDIMHLRIPLEVGGLFYRATFGERPQRPSGQLIVGAHRARAATQRMPELLALLDTLEELQREVVFAADTSESTGAFDGARRYLQAAGYLDRAGGSLVALILAD